MVLVPKSKTPPSTARAREPTPPADRRQLHFRREYEQDLVLEAPRKHAKISSNTLYADSKQLAHAVSDHLNETTPASSSDQAVVPVGATEPDQTILPKRWKSHVRMPYASALSFLWKICPNVGLSMLQVLAVALTNLTPGNVLEIGLDPKHPLVRADRPRPRATGMMFADCPHDEQTEVWHGCAPTALDSVLTTGLAPCWGAGKPTTPVIYTSPSPSCALGYPQHLAVSCSCYAGELVAPSVVPLRVLLRCIARGPARKVRISNGANRQLAFLPGDLLVRSVLLIGMDVAERFYDLPALPGPEPCTEPRESATESKKHARRRRQAANFVYPLDFPWAAVPIVPMPAPPVPRAPAEPAAPDALHLRRARRRLRRRLCRFSPTA